MFSKAVLGWGTILDAVLIALNQLLSWPASLNYIWALLALIWGIAVLAEK